jgi:hypothetical protein
MARSGRCGRLGQNVRRLGCKQCNSCKWGAVCMTYIIEFVELFGLAIADASYAKRGADLHSQKTQRFQSCRSCKSFPPSGRRRLHTPTSRTGLGRIRTIPHGLLSSEVPR